MIEPLWEISPQTPPLCTTIVVPLTGHGRQAVGEVRYVAWPRGLRAEEDRVFFTRDFGRGPKGSGHGHKLHPAEQVGSLEA